MKHALWLGVLLLVLPVTAAADEPRKEAYNLRADQQEWVEESYWRGWGNVQAQYQDITIRCDEMELDLATRRIKARGNVVLDQGPRRFTADELTYDLQTKTGLFTNATGSSPPSYYFTGAKVEKLDDTHYRLQDATFTTCGDEEDPPWEFRVRKALLEEEGYGRFRGASLRVQGAPIFYLPYLIWPVKTERAAGLLMPSYGYSDRRGAYLGNALYVPIGRSYDTTLYLDAYSKKHFGIGTEWRWAPRRDISGQLTAYTIRNADDEVWYWKVKGRHSQDDFFGFKLLAEVEDLSDINFFQEFERSFDRNTLRSLYSYVYLTRSWGPYSLNLRSDRRTTFISQLVAGEVEDAEVELAQIPEVELRVRPTRIGRSSLYWSLISSANYFSIDRGGDLTGTYGRLDVFPTLSYSLPSPPWLSITPRIGGRSTYYTARYSEDRRSLVKESIERNYLEGGVDIVGPSFSRVFNVSIGQYQKFKHLIEPRIEYSYLSDPGEIGDLPRFDEVDSTRVTNRVRVTLANRLFGRSSKDLSSRELGSFELYQEYSFSDPLNRGTIVEEVDGQSTSRYVESQRGPLGATLRLTPTPTLTLDARASYDNLFKSVTQTSLSATFSSPGSYTNVTWYEGRDRATGDRTSSQVRAALGVGRRSRFGVDLHVSYDINESEFQQQRALLHYRGSCWGISLEYRDQRLGQYPSQDYRIVIDLKDVGRLFEIQGGLSNLNEP